jgi:hypothetical protein
MYADEMLGVLLAGAGPQQRHPGLREAANLVVSAVSTRLGRAGGAITDGYWARAAAVLGVLLPIFLFLKHVRPVVSIQLWAVRFDHSIAVPGSAWLLVGGWAATAVFALCSWRLIAAVAAWATVIANTAVVGASYSTQPVTALYALWSLVLGLTAAIALTAATRLPRSTRVFGRRSAILLGVAGVLTMLAPAVDPVLARVTRGDDFIVLELWPTNGGFVPYFPADSFVGGPGLIPMILYLVVGVLALWGVARMDPPVRRRLLALLAPTIALIAVIAMGFNGFAVSSVRFSPPVLLEPVQWIVLTAVPLLAFLAAAAIVHRRERMLHLIELGKTIEQQLGTTAEPPADTVG